MDKTDFVTSRRLYLKIKLVRTRKGVVIKRTSSKHKI